MEAFSTRRALFFKSTIFRRRWGSIFMSVAKSKAVRRKSDRLNDDLCADGLRQSAFACCGGDSPSSGATTESGHAGQCLLHLRGRESAHCLRADAAQHVRCQRHTGGRLIVRGLENADVRLPARKRPFLRPIHQRQISNGCRFFPRCLYPEYGVWMCS